MRNIKWWFLFSLSSAVIVTVAVLTVWIALQKTRYPDVIIPENADTQTYAALALGLAAQERFREAFELNQKALVLSPDNASLHYNQGWLASRQEHWELALKHFNQAHQFNPEDKDTLYNRAWVYQQMGNTPMQQADLKHLSNQPLSGSTLEQVRSLKLLGQNQQALDLLNTLAPHTIPEFYYLRSRLYLALKNYEAALTDLNQLLNQSRERKTLHERAMVYKQLKNNQAALADLNECLQLESNDEDLLEKLQLQAELNPSQVITELKILLESRSDWLAGRRLYIQTLIQLKNTREAQTALDLALQAHTTDAQLWALQAQLYRQRRRYSEALKALQRAEQNGYSKALVFAERAFLAAQQNQRKEALQYMQQAIHADPTLQSELESHRLLKRWL